MIKHNMIQGSMLWHKIRLAKVTSTNLKSVLAAKGDQMKVIDELIAEEISGMSDDEDGYINDEMQRGKDLEPLAAREYEEITGYRIESVGFLQSERWPSLGVSADRLLPDLNGAVEIKCPKTKTHVRYIREGVIPKEYAYQILDYFLVDESLEFVDFVSYDPRFIVQPVFIKRVTREQLAIEIQSASIKLDSFFAMLEETKTKIIFGSVFVAQHDAEVSSIIIQKV